MEQIVEHFKTNSEIYKNGFDQLAKATVGIVMVGITMGCLHLLIYLIKILRLPKTSREYAHKSEYVEGDALIRYLIMISCVFVMDWLIVAYFQAGPRIMVIGLGFWGVYFLSKYLYNLTKLQKLKKEEKQQ